MPARNPDGRDAHPAATRPGRSTTTATSARATSPRTARSCRRSTSTRACSSSTPISTGQLLLPAQRGSRPPRDLAASRWTSSRTRSVRRCSRRSTTSASPTATTTPTTSSSPEYGDTVPSLLMRRRRHDVREGHERGLRQAGLRPLPRDRRDDQRDRPRQGRRCWRGWVEQWQEAVDQGAALHAAAEQAGEPARRTPLTQQPPVPTSAATSTARTATRATRRSCIRHMQRQGVHVYRFNARRRRRTACASSATRRLEHADAARGDAVHPDGAAAQALDPGRARRGPVSAGRLLLRRGEWSYSLQRGQSGNGFLTSTAAGRGDDRDRRPGLRLGRRRRQARCYAFDTDSMQGSPWRRAARRGREVFRGA